jgi:hypothetical protein
MRRRWAIVLAIAMLSCWNTPRSVRIGWDAPATLPAGYWILVDNRKVLDIRPPVLDPGCGCLTVMVDIPRRGRHTVRVVAYDRNGETSPSALLAVER